MRTIVAVVAALIPTLSVGYAQFYMNARATDVATKSSPREDERSVSAFAALGKILDEGKTTLSVSMTAIKNLNAAVLESSPVTTPGASATTGKITPLPNAKPESNFDSATTTKYPQK